MSILFLAKNKPFAQDAAELLLRHDETAQIIFGDRKDSFPGRLVGQRYDYVISYISPWIVPSRVLDATTKSAINFHPGPTNYPGIGCTNFAIYHEEKEYGITVHYMKDKVDTGEIIHVERFPIFEKDNVYTLTQRCYAYIFIAFVKMLPYILRGEALPRSEETWQRRPFTRQDLNALCRLTRDMDEDEVRKRTRATEYPGMPGASYDQELR